MLFLGADWPLGRENSRLPVKSRIASHLSEDRGMSGAFALGKGSLLRRSPFAGACPALPLTHCFSLGCEELGSFGHFFSLVEAWCWSAQFPLQNS